MKTEKEIMISARNLKKCFNMGDEKQTIFENLNLDIYKGDFTIIMGSSGAGKSTLMYSLSGMDRPTETLLLQEKKLQNVMTTSWRCFEEKIADSFFSKSTY